MFNVPPFVPGLSFFCVVRGSQGTTVIGFYSVDRCVRGVVEAQVSAREVVSHSFVFQSYTALKGVR